MLTLFAGAAMLLASVGLYGLVTLLVAARTREIGVRMALGARPSQIMGSVFAGAGRLLGFGVALGIGLTLLAERLPRAVVFGVSPFDALTLASAIFVLAAVSAVAAFLPARRAAAVDPIEAIRAE
jgi:ABC-type antimicrobial peptide transport system permease subunit